MPLTNALYMARNSSDRVVHEEMIGIAERQVARLVEMIDARLDAPHDSTRTAP